MRAVKADGAKIKQAVEQFGSLRSAIEQLRKEKTALEEENPRLRQERKKLQVERNRLAAEVEALNKESSRCKSQLQFLYKEMKAHSRQYELFCGFMAMIAQSPSVTGSINILISALQTLKESGWHLWKSAQDMRSLFVRTILGDYLKCFRCDACGTKFIVNREPKYTYLGSGYWCPVCHNWHTVKADDSFLKAMVSEEQLENTLQTEQVLKENAVLRPLEAFLGVPCEICGKPIIEWTKDNVKLAVNGLGWAHNKCWNSDVGMIRFMLELDKRMQTKR